MRSSLADFRQPRLAVAPGHAWLALLMSLTLGTSAAALALGHRVGVPVLSVYWEYVDAVFRLAPPLLLLGAAILVAGLALRGEREPLAALARSWRTRFPTRDEVAQTVAPVLLLPLLLGAFGTMKQLLPEVRPFTWDDTLARWSSALLGGRRGWEITHELFPSPEATLFMDRAYTLWVPLMFVVVLLVAVAASPALRARFFLSFALAFVLIGVVGAFAFSSAGPCFARAVGTASAPGYDALMARLHAIDAAGYRLQALDWQRQLWAAHAQRDYGFAMGISAMPSMHNAVCGLYVLAAWRSAAWLRALAAGFALLTLVASVHLGWHYLADGLGAWAMIAAIWFGTDALLRRSHPWPAPDAMPPR